MAQGKGDSMKLILAIILLVAAGLLIAWNFGLFESSPSTPTPPAVGAPPPGGTPPAPTGAPSGVN